MLVCFFPEQPTTKPSPVFFGRILAGTSQVFRCSKLDLRVDIILQTLGTLDFRGTNMANGRWFIYIYQRYLKYNMYIYILYFFYSTRIFKHILTHTHTRMYSTRNFKYLSPIHRKSIVPVLNAMGYKGSNHHALTHWQISFLQNRVILDVFFLSKSPIFWR